MEINSPPVPPRGPVDARIMIIGEAPGSDEVQAMKPFIGSSGKIMSKMLAEANINESQCYITNVCPWQPPGNDISKFFYNKTEAKRYHVPEIMGRYPNRKIKDGLFQLYEQIETVHPQKIITFGDTALWACTGKTGITKYRGSELQYEAEAGPIRLIPTYHPAAISRMWSWRSAAVHDLKRLLSNPQVPDYRFQVRPSFTGAVDYLSRTLEQIQGIPTHLSIDIETRNEQIACIGFATSERDAICIPLLCIDKVEGYWTRDEEIEIIRLIREILIHSNTQIIGQNFWYDAQYFARYLEILPKPAWDTYLAQHVLFPGTPKDLNYLSSLYCSYHVYWKDERNEWDPKLGEDSEWIYCCKDVVSTYEIAMKQMPVVSQRGLSDQYKFLDRLWRPATKMMCRGILVDLRARTLLGNELEKRKSEIREELSYILRQDFNPSSSPQMKQLFYNELNVPPIINRKTKKPTLSAPALEELRKRCDVILYPLIDLMIEYRQLTTYIGTFIRAKLDRYNRIHTSFGFAETFRFTSSKDVFHQGANLQNIPS